MPRVKIGSEESPRRSDGRLVDRLADEFKSAKESGQPFIYEQTFPTGKVKLSVVWDEWKDQTLEQRTNIILAAIERSDGRSYREQVALASGLTVPEAVAAGMLPYQIITALRATDPFTPEQCRKAMLDEGASTLFGPGTLQLRFPTEQSAESCRKRLIEKLPKSDDIWLISAEFSGQVFGQSLSPTEGTID